MRKKGDIWTQEELDILANGMPTRKQAELLPGRTKPAIQQKKDSIRLEGAKASTKRSWSEKEISILRNGRTSKIQAAMLNGRSIAAIDCKKKSLRIGKGKHIKVKPGPQKDPDAYSGRPVKPYQFITIAEAGPERVKEWKREERQRGQR